MLIIACTALALSGRKQDSFSGLYKIEINRVENELRVHGGEEGFFPDISVYETIKGVALYDEEEPSADFYNSDYSYVLRQIEGRLYRIDYSFDLSQGRKSFFLSAVITVMAVMAAMFLVLFYIYMSIIRPLNRISEYPMELSKGNLSVPLDREKNKFFDRFLWGLDMLREKLEDEKKRNLELEKEKNVFLLSLSHDMKTPISAIRLYAAALKKNLYSKEDKLREVGGKIEDNAGEIEKYVSRIVSSAGEGFLELNAREEEIYLSEIMNSLNEYYSDKLSPLGTEFTIEKYSDVLLSCDRDRLTEVLQNIMENAIKYGDGGYIRISFDDEDGARLITIANSGCALPEAEREHIFESFYRGSNVGSKPGSGLGLYISRKLMQKMGGEIFSTVDSGVMKVTVVVRKV